jgi:hypothetical protein
MVAGYSYAFHSVQFNPVEPRLVLAANQKAGIGLWDLRQVLNHYYDPNVGIFSRVYLGDTKYILSHNVRRGTKYFFMGKM